MKKYIIDLENNYIIKSKIESVNVEELIYDNGYTCYRIFVRLDSGRKATIDELFDHDEAYEMAEYIVKEVTEG